MKGFNRTRIVDWHRSTLKQIRRDRRSGKNFCRNRGEAPDVVKTSCNLPYHAIAVLNKPHLSRMPSEFVQQRTRPKLYVTVGGVALRCGYGVPVPEVVSIGGKRPVLVGQPWFTQGVVGGTIVPVVKAEWSLTYLFTDTDGGAPLKPVPVPSSGLLARS